MLFVNRSAYHTIISFPPPLPFMPVWDTLMRLVRGIPRALSIFTKKKRFFAELHDFEESFTCYHAVMVIWDASLGANVSERKSKSLHPRPAPWLLNRNLKIDLYFLIHLQIKRIPKRQNVHHIQKGTYKSVKKISLGFCSFDHNN